MKDQINLWKDQFPILEEIIAYKPVFWLNPNYESHASTYQPTNFSITDLIDAEARYHRFAPYFKKAFKETKDQKGIIESPLIRLKDYYKSYKVFLKADHSLPISGSIKARGGIYEVIRHAESLLFKAQMIDLSFNYALLSEKKYQDFFSNYKIVVSSTGNLGLSIGIISASLGFKVEVHMSRDAMAWKKSLLRSMGVCVIEYPEDYSHAVTMGRKSAMKDHRAYFVDDESSVNLFLGYGVSALRLRKQLESLSLKPTIDQPLFVYIPCGVGGGPGGIAWALKEVFGPAVHCVFVEPTHSPCMLLGMMTGKHDEISVGDFGLDNMTIADGLAVGKASAFVGKIMTDRLLGVSTVEDHALLNDLKDIHKRYDMFLEPSALAGFKGFRDVITMNNHETIKSESILKGIHILWSTGGKMVPENIQNDYLNEKNTL